MFFSVYYVLGPTVVMGSSVVSSAILISLLIVNFFKDVMVGV